MPRPRLQPGRDYPPHSHSQNQYRHPANNMMMMMTGHAGGAGQNAGAGHRHCDYRYAAAGRHAGGGGGGGYYGDPFADGNRNQHVNWQRLQQERRANKGYGQSYFPGAAYGYPGGYPQAQPGGYPMASSYSAGYPGGQLGGYSAGYPGGYPAAPHILPGMARNSRATFAQYGRRQPMMQQPSPRHHGMFSNLRNPFMNMGARRGYGLSRRRNVTMPTFGRQRSAPQRPPVYGYNPNPFAHPGMAARAYTYPMMSSPYEMDSLDDDPYDYVLPSYGDTYDSDDDDDEFDDGEDLVDSLSDDEDEDFYSP